jgi:hypothetical protein
VTPTRARDLLAAAAVGVLAGLLLLRLVYLDLPPLPWTAPLSLLVIALVEFQVAAAVRARLAGRPGTKPIPPIAVARTAALAKASSLAAALVGGGWAAALGYLIPRVGEFPAAGRDLVVSACGLAAAGLLVAAALRLERACRVPPPPGPRPA